MRFLTSASLLLVILFTSATSALRAWQSPAVSSLAPVAAPVRPAAGDAAVTVTTYCSGCHNGVMRSPSNALLDGFDGAAIGDAADAWARAYRQVQAGTMPPAGARRPDRVAAGRLLASIETALGATTRPANASSGEIADRLASMLWNSTPDAALLKDVRRNRLSQPATVEQQVKRMLADDRADALVSRFFVPWLGLDQLGKANPSAKNFPEFDATLRDAMATETRLFIRNQLREDGDPITLWTARETFLNEPLARHYGIAGVTGAEFRRVSLNVPERYGLLGQASI